MPKINVMPINWFGDKEAYKDSDIRIITVGLNPSHMEFREHKQDSFSSKIRFSDFDGKLPSLWAAYSNYFKNKPYKWFHQGFEHVLNGLDASYGGLYNQNNKYHNTALHTDFCSTWATDPTWSKLSKKEQIELMQDGVEDWRHRVSRLKPDIIIFSLPDKYIQMLFTPDDMQNLFTYKEDKNGKPRKSSVDIKMSRYDEALCIFGKTRNIPFGMLSNEQKEDLGRQIKNVYDTSFNFNIIKQQQTQLLDSIMNGNGDCLCILNNQHQDNFENILNRIVKSTDKIVVPAVYAANPNDLGYDKQEIVRRTGQLELYKNFGEQIPPIWAYNIAQNTNENEKYILLLNDIQLCTPKQLAAWRSFIKTRTICGLHLTNVQVCATFVIYPEDNIQISQEDAKFFDITINW